MDDWNTDGYENYDAYYEAETSEETRWRYLQGMCEAEGHPICNFYNGWASCECGKNQHEINGVELAKVWLKAKKCASKG